MMGNINTGQICVLDRFLVGFCFYFKKDFLVFLLFASHEVQTTIETGIKRHSLPPAQRMGVSACCI